MKRSSEASSRSGSSCSDKPANKTWRSWSTWPKRRGRGIAPDVATYILIPAFIISELKTGFQMGFVLFLPFIVIDFVVSSVLLSMGMMFPAAHDDLPYPSNSCSSCWRMGGTWWCALW